MTQMIRFTRVLELVVGVLFFLHVVVFGSPKHHATTMRRPKDPRRFGFPSLPRRDPSRHQGVSAIDPGVGPVLKAS